MYDSHIYCEEYKEIKDLLADIINGEIEDYDLDAIEDNIQELYDNDEMSSSQYDDLMSYVMDLK